MIDTILEKPEQAPVKYEVPSYMRELKPENISDEAALRFAASILITIANDYMDALANIKEIKEKSGRITKSDKAKLQRYTIDKNRCESFYKSRRFQILSMGRALPYDELLMEFQRKVDSGEFQKRRRSPNKKTLVS